MARPTYVYHALGKGKSDRNMEPFYIEIFPDPSVERKTSSHQGEEFILVLEGELLVIDLDLSFRLVSFPVPDWG